MLIGSFVVLSVFVILFGILVGNAYASGPNIPVYTEQDGGVKVVGRSLNPPKEHHVNHGRIFLMITETDKHKAIDENGRIWSFDKTWKMDYIPREKSTAKTKHGIDRHHILFDSHRKTQQSIAMEKLDKVCEKCFDESFAEINKIFSYEFPERVHKLADPKIQRTMQFEALRAAKYLESKQNR